MTSRRFHQVATVAWFILLLPSVTWWKESLPWLVFMSGYALVAAHWAAVEGAKSDEHNKKLMQEVIDRLDRLDSRG